MAIELIVGLGNPGKQYQKTRHNAGFLFLQRLIDRLTLAPLTQDKHCKGRVAKATIANVGLRLLEPDTFMNLSGQAVVATCSYYKIESKRILVVHDDLDLPVGVIRLKKGGGHGGNNGLRDIIQQTTQRDFYRLRVGIGHPGVGKDVASYVLKKPSQNEQTSMQRAIDASIDHIDDIINGNHEHVMNQLHSTDFR